MNMNLFNKIYILTMSEISQLVHYRLALIFRVLGGLFPFVTMFVWLNLIDSGFLVTENKSYFVIYFVYVFVVGQVISSPVIGTVVRDIRLGRLSRKLLRPINPYFGYFSAKLALIIISLPYILIPIILLHIFKPNNYTFQSYNLPLFIISTLLAIGIHFNRQIFMGLLAFWLEKSDALDRMFVSLQQLLSGIFIPLFLLSEEVQKLILFTPFPYTIYIPVTLGTQKLDLHTIIIYLSGQIFWFAFLLVLNVFTWNRGIKRYSAAGA